MRLAKLAVLACSLVALAAPANALKYAELKDPGGKTVLLIYDEIRPDDSKTFGAEVAKHPDAREYWLASPGGSVSASYDIGRMLRASKRPVRVPGAAHIAAAVANTPNDASAKAALKYTGQYAACASACGMLLAGGLIRFVDEPYLVGLHSATSMHDDEMKQLIREGMKVDEADTINAVEGMNQRLGFAWTRYMQEMGVSATFVEVASGVPSGCMYYLSAEELDRLNLVNVKGAKTQGPPGAGKKKC